LYCIMRVFSSVSRMQLVLTAFVCTLAYSHSLVQSRSIPGVHFGLPITPSVKIPDSRWLLDVYLIVFDRPYDGSGFMTNFKLLQSGASRVSLFNGFIDSAEFRNSPRLADRANYTVRVYQHVLGRSPSSEEVQSQLTSLRNCDGSGSGRTWPMVRRASACACLQSYVSFNQSFCWCRGRGQYACRLHRLCTTTLPTLSSFLICLFDRLFSC
jgi:hypothetical protein